MIITIGDFNAKIGRGKSEYPENIGKYGKGGSTQMVGAFLNMPKHMIWYLPTQCWTIKYVIEALGIPLRE